MTQNRCSSSHQQFSYIEVAVRLRPLNLAEKARTGEGAWDVKVGTDATSLAMLHRRSQQSLGGAGCGDDSGVSATRRSVEVLAEGQGKVIMLKNKFRFGLVETVAGEEDQGRRETADERCRKMGSRYNSVMKLHHSQNRKTFESHS